MFDVLDEDIARELLAGTGRLKTVKSLWNRMHNRLFHFYMSQLGTKSRTSLYPGSEFDTGSVDGIIGKFDKNYFLDRGFNPDDRDRNANHFHTFVPNFEGWVESHNLTLVSYDLRRGLPDYLSPVDWLDGTEVQIYDRTGKRSFRENSVDLLIVKGPIMGGDSELGVDPLRIFLERLPKVLHPNALVVIHYDAYYIEYENGKAEDCSERVWTNEKAAIKYYHPFFLQDVQGLDFVDQLDFRLPENIATEMQEKIGEPFKYLNQTNPWFFYRMAETKAQ